VEENAVRENYIADDVCQAAMLPSVYENFNRSAFVFFLGRHLNFCCTFWSNIPIRDALYVFNWPPI